MNKRVVWIAVVSVAVFGSMAAVSAEGQFFTSFEAAYTEITFQPEYTFMYNRPNREFTNRGRGSEFDLVAGYRLQPNENFSLALAGSIGMSTVDWSARTEHGEGLQYEIPYRLFTSLQPAWHFADRWRLFGEVGVGRALIEQRKTSVTPDRSRYDEEDCIWGYRLGAGLGYAMAAGWEVSLAYRHSQYESFSYNTHLDEGSHWETVKDKPYASSVLVSIAKFW